MRDINITAQSGTSGENPSGSVSMSILLPDPVTEQFVFTPISGPVTCLGVTGPDQGAGTPEEPTTATLNFDATSVFSSGQTVHIGILTAQFVDKGGNGQDTFAGAPAGSREPTDCSPVPGEGTPLTNGRAIVFDAPSLPTSKDQCKNGGWRDFPQFKNQGDCISFVTDRH